MLFMLKMLIMLIMLLVMMRKMRLMLEWKIPTQKASARLDKNCFSNGCTQYISLSGKYQALPLDYVRNRCPPGTEITDEAECRKAAQHLGRPGQGNLLHYLEYQPQCSSLHICFCLEGPPDLGIYFTGVTRQYYGSNSHLNRAVCRNCWILLIAFFHIRCIKRKIKVCLKKCIKYDIASAWLWLWNKRDRYCVRVQKSRWQLWKDFRDKTNRDKCH